ncbi:MAG: hypothetical protein K8L97_01640 [Anaerolineae bacterium]|nr:hypothetical protein [Anaerolineae bacterium]
MMNRFWSVLRIDTFPRFLIYIALLAITFIAEAAFNRAVPELNALAQLVGLAGRIISIVLVVDLLFAMLLWLVQGQTPPTIPLPGQAVRAGGAFFGGIALFAILTLWIGTSIANARVLLFIVAYLSSLFSIFVVRQLWQQEAFLMTNNTQRDGSSGNNVTPAAPQYSLARVLITFVVVGITFLALIAITQSPAPEKADVTNQILTAVLPLFGTWIGTIMAFYYTKDNLDAANRNVNQLVNKIISPDEKLQATAARDKMILYGQMYIVREGANDKLLAKLKEMDDEAAKAGSKNKWNRIPVLNQNDQPVYVVHRSLINEFLAAKAQENPPPNLADLTFKDLHTHKDFVDRKLLDTTFRTVKVGDSLASAKKLLDEWKDRNCQDVFVTSDGTDQGKVIGWITNVVIQEAATIQQTT